MRAKIYYQIRFSAITLAAMASLSVINAVLAVSCGDTITTAEVLDNDITSCASDPAITIVGPNGSLNLNNHNISCIGVGTGIFLDGMFANLTGGEDSTSTISNCGVSLRFQGDGFHFVSGINATDASMAGVIIQSTHNILTNTNSSDNNGTGIIIFGSDNTLNQVTVEENTLDGIITFADRILISDSQVSSNEPSGIVIQGSDDSSFIQNTFNSNSSFGMFVSGLGQTGNQMIGNTALNNGSTDLVDLNSNCAGTTWLGNTFVSANEACIE